MIPNRSEYLKQQALQGQKIMGVLPALYPKELLWAFDILPAEIWDPPGDIVKANRHLQTTICPIVKQSLEFILTEPGIVNAGYLFPHTCDSLQNLGSQVKDMIGVPVPVYTFYNPKGNFNKATRAYYGDILNEFLQVLADVHGPPDIEKLRAACELGLKIDGRRIELQQARMTDRLSLNSQQYFQLIRAAEFMQPVDYLYLLNQVEIQDEPLKSHAIRFLISGILPPNDMTLSFLDDLGIGIVAEDLLAGSRRIPIATLDPPADPIEYLTDRFFLLPPCSTKAGSLDHRQQYLKKLASDSKAQAVLFNIVKFCEPELFDHRSLVKSLKNEGLPVLSLETELLPGLSGQTQTRIEAIVEMMGDEVLA
ncbi:2-hydroxyacyl-CoA dehydratase [bacterium]|nr:2-hydroxyacyl-CoA dehydratase [bacterium]